MYSYIHKCNMLIVNKCISLFCMYVYFMVAKSFVLNHEAVAKINCLMVV